MSIPALGKPIYHITSSRNIPFALQKEFNSSQSVTIEKIDINEADWYILIKYSDGREKGFWINGDYLEKDDTLHIRSLLKKYGY